MAYVTRTHGERPHAKFQPPAMTSLAVHKGHTTVQNKGNANIFLSLDTEFLPRFRVFFRRPGKKIPHFFSTENKSFC